MGNTKDTIKNVAKNVAKGTRKLAIKGAKTMGKCTAKALVVGGKTVTCASLRALSGVVKSKAMKSVVGLGLTVGALYLFGPALVTAGVVKGLAIDPLLGKNPNVIQGVMDTVRGTNEVLKSISDPVLDGIGEIPKDLSKGIQDLGR